MLAEIIVLRLLHIIGGVFWVGTALFNTFYLVPALTAAGPAAGQIMASLQQRKLFTVLPLVAVVTMLTGLRLIWIASSGFEGSYFESATGSALAAGGLAAIVAFVIGLAVVRPAMMRAGQLTMQLQGVTEPAQRDPIVAQMAILRRRGAKGNAGVTLLLLLAAAAMAVARYLT